MQAQDKKNGAGGVVGVWRELRTWLSRLAEELRFLPQESREQGGRDGRSASDKPDAEGEDTALRYDRNIRVVLRGAVLLVVGWCFGSSSLAFSASPLPLALLAAAQDGLGWCLIGVLLGLWQAADRGSLGGHVALYLGAVALLLALRLVYRVRGARGTDSRETNEARVGFAAGLCATLVHLLHLGRRDAKSSEDGAPERRRMLGDTHEQPVSRQVATALVAALIPAVGASIRSDFSFYELCGAILCLVGAPLLTALFVGAWQQNSGAEHGLWRLSALAAMYFFVCYLLRAATLFGSSPVLILGTTLALLMLRRFGLGAGVIVALLSGVALDVKILPMLLLLLFIDALLSTALGGLGLAMAVLVALLCPLFMGGTALLWQTMPSFLVGVLIFGAVGRLTAAHARVEQQRAQRCVQGNEDVRQLMCEQACNQALSARISGMAGAFGSLSEVFRTLGETLGRPDAAQIRMMMDEIFDERCPACAHKGACWSEEYSETAQGVRLLSRQLAAKPDSSAVNCLPEGLRRRCPHMVDMLDELHYRIGRRTFEQREDAQGALSARCYDSIACLMRDLLHEQGRLQDEQKPSPEKSEAVARWLNEHGVRTGQVCVSGARQWTVRIKDIRPSALTVPVEELQAALGEICGVSMDKPRYEGSEDDCLTLRGLPLLHVEYAHVCEAAEPQRDVGVGRSKPTRTPCGDTLRVFEGEGGMLYALLCDGMGAGRRAALTSGPTAIFLERVLQSGVSVGTALRMLNQDLRARSAEDESSCTVDLFALDLYTGQARFIKCGAAPSWIVRASQVHRIVSHTVPLGILQAVDAQVVPFEVKAGDRILLMSDGISDTLSSGEGKEDWLSEVLAQPPMQAMDDRSLAELLIREARGHGACDDASVICLHMEALTPPARERAENAH